MKLFLKYLILIALLFPFGILLFTHCAKVVAPTGGPKDTIPPEPVKEIPANYSTGFSTGEIEIEFDEFIKLKQAEKQFISSPPFEEKPVIEERGKELRVELIGTLKDSTTYTLNFGNSIVDFREENPLRNFRYVFSTGPVLDSLFVEGQVFDAYSLDPLENVVVMLYENYHDSLPLQQRPDYVSRSDKQGYFYLPNLRKDQYKIFALKDQNDNYIYDSPKENIGFSDSVITFTRKEFTERDTIYNDTIQLENSDSLVIDTVKTRHYSGLRASSYRLKLFNEDKGEQYLKSYSRKKPQRISFVFNRPVKDSISLNIIDSVYKDVSVLEEKEMHDTLAYWIIDSTIYNKEYLTFEMGYISQDSTGEDYFRTDTAELGYSFEKEIPDTVNLSTNASGADLMDLNRNIRVSHSYPLKSIDTSQVCLWKIQDTILHEQPVQIKRDTESLFSFHLKNKLKQDSKYKLRVLPGAVKTIYDYHHDTLEKQFTTQTEDYYGEITMELNVLDQPFVFQLLTLDGKLYTERWYPASTNKKVNIRYIDPGEYIIRLILDENGNKEWDSGDYLRHIQPEKVTFYPQKINVPSNWELELKWDADFNSFVKPKIKEE